jgi:hypothetical protein
MFRTSDSAKVKNKLFANQLYLRKQTLGEGGRSRTSRKVFGDLFLGIFCYVNPRLIFFFPGNVRF